MAKLMSILCAAVVVMMTPVGSSAVAQPAAAAGSEATAVEIEGLVAVLRSSTADEREKVRACQRLGVIGDARAIPVLGSLLADEKLGHAARMGLEANPDPAVDAELRRALGRLRGNALVGAIDSIGRRRDVKAVDELVKRLRGNDAAVGDAAAIALGRIGDEKAVAALEAAVGEPATGARAAVLEAYLLAADHASASGKQQAAAAMFERLARREGAPKPVRVAALRGLIVAKGDPEGTKLAVEQLRSDDGEMFGVALGVLQEAKGAALATAYAKELGALPAERQVRLIDALAGRGGNEALGALRLAAGSADARVRVAGLRAVSQLGDVEALGLLLQAATGDDAAVAKAAQAALVTFPRSEADAGVLAMLTSDKAASRRIGIELISKRRIAGATAALVKAAQDEDEQTRLAAIRALGDVAPAGEIGTVIAVLLDAKAGGDAEAAERAVAAVIGRAEPRQAAAEPLIAAMPDAGAAGRCALLRLLANAGGARALETVRGSTKAFDKQVQDAAIRALCAWATAEPAADVLAIAKNGENPVHKRLALRGYVRMIADANLTAEQRGAMCGEAVALAQNADDKKLVLATLGAVPTKEALGVVVTWMDDAAVGEEAVAAAIAIAGKLRASEPDAVTAALTKAASTTKSEDLARRAKELLASGRSNGR